MRPELSKSRTWMPRQRTVRATPRRNELGSQLSYPGSITSTLFRRSDVPRCERVVTATTISTTNPPRRMNLPVVDPLDMEKNTDSRRTAPKSATDAPAMVNWPTWLSDCPASLRTGTTRPNEVADSAIPIRKRPILSTPPALGRSLPLPPRPAKTRTPRLFAARSVHGAFGDRSRGRQERAGTPSRSAKEP